MRTGDLIQDWEQFTLALILGEDRDKYIVYYLSGDVAGDIVCEDVSSVKRFFKVISYAVASGEAGRENFVGVLA